MTPIVHTRRDDHGVPAQPTAVGEAHRARRTVDLEPHHLTGGDHLRAELGGLAPRPIGQLRTRQSAREAQVVLDPRTLPRLTAGRGPFHQHRAQALGGAVDGRAESGGTAADDDQIVEITHRFGAEPDAARQLAVGGLQQRLPVGGDHHRTTLRIGARGLEQPRALRLVGQIPAIGQLVAGQELAHLRRARRPAVADHLGAGHRFLVAAAPGLQQGVEHRVELLLRRIPRLEQIVIEVDDVDRVDRGIGVGIGGEQHSPRVRMQVHGLLQEFDAVHPGHAVVGDQHRDRLVAQFQFTQGFQGLRTRFRAQDAVVGAVAPAQIADDGPGDARVVVDAENGRLGGSGGTHLMSMESCRLGCRHRGVGTHTR